MKIGLKKLVSRLLGGENLRDPTVISFESIPACDGRTERRTDSRTRHI